MDWGERQLYRTKEKTVFEKINNLEEQKFLRKLSSFKKHIFLLLFFFFQKQSLT